jgi:hypothetical protein
MEHDNPEFEEACGIYVGPATHDEVVAALRDVPATSELVVRIDNRESSRPEQGIRYRHGWPEHFHDKYPDGGARDLFVVYQHEQALGYGVMYQDAPFVIWLSSDYPNLDADRYTGGVRLRSPFGTVIDVAVWHGIEHVTETGDAAPGFGPFELSDWRSTSQDQEG